MSEEASPGATPAEAVIDQLPSGSEKAPSSLPQDKATPVATSAPSSEFVAEVGKLSSPADIEALLRKLQNSPAPEKPEKTDEEKKETEEIKPPGEEKTAPGAEATPAAEKTEPAKEPQGTPADESNPDGEPKPEENGDGDEDLVSPLKGNRARLTFREDDKLGRLAAMYMHRNRDWGMEQALEAAKKQLGIGQPPAEEKNAAAEPAKSADGMPDTVEEIETAVSKLEAERAKALVDLKFEDVAKMDAVLRKLDVKRIRVERENERAEERQAASEKVAYDAAFDAAEKKAIASYDFAADPNSEGGKRMIEIEKQMEESDDPTFHDPEKPLIIAQMVARELRIAPKSPTAAKPATVRPANPAAAGKPADKPKSILPGGSGKTAAPPSPNGEFASKVTAIKNQNDLRKMLEASGINLAGI